MSNQFTPADIRDHIKRQAFSGRCGWNWQMKPQPESMEQFPSVESQQAHWQAKDEEADEALRQQREREQLADVEREERERDHDSKWDHPKFDRQEDFE